MPHDGQNWLLMETKTGSEKFARPTKITPLAIHGDVDTRFEPVDRTGRTDDDLRRPQRVSAALENSRAVTRSWGRLIIGDLARSEVEQQQAHGHLMELAG